MPCLECALAISVPTVIVQTGSVSCLAHDLNFTGCLGNASSCMIENAQACKNPSLCSHFSFAVRHLNNQPLMLISQPETFWLSKLRVLLFWCLANLNVIY